MKRIEAKLLKHFILFFFLTTPIINQGQNIEIQKEHLLINGIRVTEKSTITDYINIIGEPTRIDTFKRDCYYYFDQNGIGIFTDSLNKVNSIEFKFSKAPEWKSSLKGKFSGKLSITELNLEISKNTGYKEIKSMIKHSTNIDPLDNFDKKIDYGEPLITSDNFESTDFDNEDKETDFKYGIYEFNFDHNYFQTSTQIFTIDFIKPPKRITKSSKTELNLGKIYSFVNSLKRNDTLLFNMTESANFGFWGNEFSDIIKDTIFSNEDIDFIKQQLTIVDEFQWEQSKIKRARFISKKTLKKTFKHHNGWEIFHEKFGESLWEYSMPIFSKNYEYCIFYSSIQSDGLSGGGGFVLYKLIDNKWVFIKEYSFWIS